MRNTTGTYSRMTETAPLGIRMKRERMRRGLNQIEAANSLGIGISQWRNLEQGMVVPNSQYIPIIEAWITLR